MNPLQQRFPHRRHVLLPVIHADSPEQCIRNAEIACTSGCDGVFLINHGISVDELLRITAYVRTQFASFWVGVNCLGLPPEDVFAWVDDSINGIWVDNAMIDERCENQDPAKRADLARQMSGWRGLYFGGVAFKYQRTVDDVESAARLATRFMDVVTTSGSGTGEAAQRAKIARMKSALGDRPLAIASGISPANVADYLEVADCFLVATGISRTFTDFDPELVKDLVLTVRSFSPSVQKAGEQP